MALLLHVTQTYGHGLATCCVRTHPSLAGVTFRAQGNFVVRETFSASTAAAAEPPSQLLFRGASAKIVQIAVSPRGDLVAAAQTLPKPDILLFDAETGALVAQLAEHDHDVKHLAFSPDGRVLVSVDAHEKLVFWDALTRNVITSLAASPNPMLSVAFGPGAPERGFYELAAGGDKVLVVWELDATTGRVGMRKAMAGTYQRKYTALCFSDEGSLCAGTASGDVVTFGLKGLNLVTVQQAASHGVTAILPTEDGSLLVGGGDGALTVLFKENNASATLPRTYFSGGIVSLEADASAGSLVVATDEGCIYEVASSDLGSTERAEGHSACVRCVAWPKEVGDAGFLAASDDGTVRLWRVDGSGLPSRLARVAAHGGVEAAVSVAILPDGLVLSGWADGVLRCHALLDTSSGPADALADELWSINGAGGRNGAAITALAVGEDGTVVACGGANGDLNVFDVATRRLIHTFPEHRKEVTRLCFFQDGPVLLSASRDSTFSVVDVYSKQRISQHLSRTTNIADAAVCPDQLTVLTVGQDGSICYWKLDEVAPAMVVEAAHEQGANCLCLDDSGELLATGGGDGFVRLWDVASGELLAEGAFHSSPVRSVSFDSSGSRLVSSASDGSLVTWQVERAA
ncbi:flagellar associated protein [Pycnococcus provasolii]